MIIQVRLGVLEPENVDRIVIKGCGMGVQYDLEAMKIQWKG